MAKKIYFKKPRYSLFPDDEFTIDAESAAIAQGGMDYKHTGDKKSSELETPIVDVDKNRMLKYICFGSGSSGICSYLGNDEGGVLIDAGVDIKTVEKALLENNISPSSISGICITHDHGDHVRYAYSFLRKHKGWHLFCTNRALNGIFRKHNISRRIKDFHVAIYKEIPFKVAGFEITAFEVSHDGMCNSGFSVAFGNANFVVATDMGVITDRARHYIEGADYLMIESNYDAKMLDEGAYPEYLKSRIRNATGHLDNAVTAAFLAEIYTSRLKYVFLCHLSKDNNTPELARTTVMKALTDKGVAVGDGNDSLVDRAKDVQLVVLPRYEVTRCYKFRVPF